MKKIEDYLFLYTCSGITINVEKYGYRTLLGCSKIGFSHSDLAKSHHTDNDFESTKVRPILRHLSGMTQDEEMEVANICNLISGANILSALKYKRKYLIDANYSFELTQYLLKQGFDLFQLIEAGLAIDKTTLK